MDLTSHVHGVRAEFAQAGVLKLHEAQLEGARIEPQGATHLLRHAPAHGLKVESRESAAVARAVHRAEAVIIKEFIRDEDGGIEWERENRGGGTYISRGRLTASGSLEGTEDLRGGRTPPPGFVPPKVTFVFTRATSR